MKGILFRCSRSYLRRGPHRKNGRPPEIRCAGSRLHLYISAFIDTDGWREQPVVNLWPGRRFYVKKWPAVEEFPPAAILVRFWNYLVNVINGFACKNIRQLFHWLISSSLKWTEMCEMFFGEKINPEVTWPIEPANGGPVTLLLALLNAAQPA